jgi:hypothetical protein
MIADIAEELRQGLKQAWAKRLQHERAAAALRSLIDGYETALEALIEDGQVPSRASVEPDRPVLGENVAMLQRLQQLSADEIKAALDATGLSANRIVVEPVPPIPPAVVERAVRKMNEQLSTKPAPAPHENAKAWADLVASVKQNGKRAAVTPAATASRKRNTNPGRPWKVDHVEVARVAREAATAGEIMTEAVSAHFGCSASAARQRILKAREAGENIPPADMRQIAKTVQQRRRPAGATKGSPITVEAAAALIEDGAA